MIRLYRHSFDDPRYVDHLVSCTELMWDVAHGMRRMLQRLSDGRLRQFARR
jgi:hypothetical protein